MTTFSYNQTQTPIKLWPELLNMHLIEHTAWSSRRFGGILLVNHTWSSVSQSDQVDGFCGKQKENVPPCSLDMVRIKLLFISTNACRIYFVLFFSCYRVQSLNPTAGNVSPQRAPVIYYPCHMTPRGGRASWHVRTDVWVQQIVCVKSHFKSCLQAKKLEMFVSGKQPHLVFRTCWYHFSLVFSSLPQAPVLGPRRHPASPKLLKWVFTDFTENVHTDVNWWIDLFVCRTSICLSERPVCAVWRQFILWRGWWPTSRSTTAPVSAAHTATPNWGEDVTNGRSVHIKKEQSGMGFGSLTICIVW